MKTSILIAINCTNKKRKPKDEADIPDVWPNGSGIYSKVPKGGTWQRGYDENKNLLGRSFLDNGQVKAWRYINGDYKYIGKFETSRQAFQRITGVV